MGSIVVKRVKGIQYIQYMEGKKIIHLGRMDSKLAWKRAWNLLLVNLQRASIVWLAKYKFTMSKSFKCNSQKEFDAMVPEICRKFSKDSKQAEWLEKQIRKLSSV